jgi:ABC-type nitrate/sulfonate/bicarbonate transport system substrate-binding protein
MLQRFRRFAGVLLVALLTLWAPQQAHAQSAGGPQQTITIIETDPGAQDIPLLEAQKIAGDYNLKVDLTGFTGGGEAGEVFIGGRGDLLVAGGDKIVGMYKHSPGQVKIIGNVLARGGWDIGVLKTSPIKKMSDVKGKNIGVTGPGSSSEMFVRAAVRHAGLDPDKDANIISVGTPLNLQAALENNRIDAAALAGVAMIRLRKANTINILTDFNRAEYPGDVFIGRTPDLAAKHDLLLKFMQIYKVALKRVHTDRALSIKLMKERYPTLTDDDSADLTSFMEPTWASLDGRVSEKSYANARDVWISSGRYTAADIPAYKDVVQNFL